jgi:hypothetical protein
VSIRITAVVLLVFAAGFLLEASRYPFGTVGTPGAGFLPITLGAAFAVLSAVLFVRPGLPPGPFLPPDRAAALRIGITILTIGLAIALLDRLGFLVVGTLMMLVLFLTLDRRPIRDVVLAPVSVILVYAVFKIWLRVPLPAGLLSF